MGALITLAAGVLARVAGRGAVGTLARQGALFAGGGLIGAEATGGGPFPGFFGLGAGGGAAGGFQRRRRRRRALTMSDMQLALTIASAISKKAAENFILMRTKGS